MMIYFEDGELTCIEDLPYYENIYIKVDAAKGFSHCKNILDTFKENEERLKFPIIVYTNSLLALNNDYAWNDEYNVPEIYIRDKRRDFTRIDKLTQKALRKAHNIGKMYIAGAFRNEV